MGSDLYANRAKSGRNFTTKRRFDRRDLRILLARTGQQASKGLLWASTYRRPNWHRHHANHSQRRGPSGSSS